MPDAIQTGKVTDRRSLQFRSLDDLSAEVECIVAAEQAGRLRRTGNWTPGQIFGHLSTWIDYGWEGYPMRVPWFIKFFIRRKLPHYLREGMPAGVHIPRTPGGTYATEVMSTEAGARRLRQSIARLNGTEPAKYHSPAFGEMSMEDRIRLNLRHAELHLSFLQP